MNQKFVVLTVMILALGSPMFSSAASWVLYDDFSSGTLDPQKWTNTSSVSTITVENQRVKIVHEAGHPNKSGYLNLIQDREKILGIKAAITVSSCTGDVRTRIAGYAAKMGENNIWSAIQLEPGSTRIYTYSEVDGPAPDYRYVNDLHYAQFMRPLDLLGNTYNVSMSFLDDRITYEVEGLGKIDYKYATAVEAATIQRAIGTRSTNGDGPCTVYVDNVYVFRP